MDSGATIVALIFVVTILTSLGNKGYHQPYAPPAEIRQQITQMKLPDPVFSEETSSESAGSSIRNYISRYRNSEESQEIAGSIMKYSRDMQVNPRLVAALIARESRFNPRAVSSSNAKGLGQLLPSTCKTVKVDDPFDIDQNVRGTVTYLKYLLDRFAQYKEKVALALGSYLEGPNSVQRTLAYSSATAAYVQDIVDICNSL